jgi:hypothetical protein
MLTSYAALIGASVAVVAIILSATSLVLHWLEREKSPQVQELHSRCDALQLAQVDMLDRIEHWTRRDRVRRLRESEPNTQSETPNAPSAPSNQAELKQQLRSLAKLKGMT